MDEMFQRFVDNGFSEFTGLTVEASVPITDEIINEFIALTLRGNPNIHGCRISIGLQNQVVAHLITPLWFRPLNLKLKLAKFGDLNGSLMVKARMENHLLLGKLGSLLNMLPEGISLRGEWIVVDIGSLVSEPGYKKLYGLLKSVELHTEQNKVICNIRVAVNESPKNDPVHVPT